MTWVLGRGALAGVQAAIVGGACLAAGCETAGEDGAVAPRGEVGLALALSSDVQLDRISYDVSGNGFSQTGNVDVSHSDRFVALISGIPQGTGFTIRLSADDASGRGVHCEGSQRFDIVRNQTTAITVQLQCSVPRTTGGVQVTGDSNLCPQISGLSALPASLQVGTSASISASARDLDQGPSPLSYAWSATSGTIASSTASATTFTCATAGAVTLTVTVSDSRCSDSVSAVLTCTGGSAPAPANVRINEVESNNGTPGDWVELYNAGGSSADLSGFVLRDNDDTHIYTLAQGTTLPAGAYLVLDENTNFTYGLGGADSVRLSNASGTLVDSYTWTTHAAVTYGRCPDGTGDFANTVVSTKGAANACGFNDAGVPDAGVADASAPDATVDAGGALSFLPWPANGTVVAAESGGSFASNLSGLWYQPASAGAGVLWAVQNSPSRLFRLVGADLFTFDTNNGWSTGKTLLYPSGTGAPDVEGVTKLSAASDIVYVATERDNNNNGVSRLSILRFDSSGSATSLVATHEWNVTADLPVVGANLGLEAITFVPDAFLVARGLRDESTGATYDPSRYPNHEGGLLFVGVEATGQVYGYALNLTTSAFTRIASFSSGMPGVMDISLDGETGYLWAHCDDTCNNRSTILEIDAGGRFVVTRAFERATGLDNYNFEGIALQTEAECVSGQKRIFYSDDNATGTISLRRGSVPCGRFF